MMSVKRRGSGRAFLDRHDVGNRREPLERFELDGHAIRRRIVVQHDGQRGRLGDRAEVVQQLFGRRHVDHRRQHHQRIDADLLSVVRELEARSVRELRHARDQRHASADRFDGGTQRRAFLFRLAASCSRRRCRADTSPSTPSSTRAVTVRRHAAISSEKSAANCVVAAG